MRYSENLTIDFIKFHCNGRINFNSKIEITHIKVYKYIKKDQFLKLRNYFLYFVENDWINYRENSIDVYIVNDLTSKKLFIVAIEFQYFPNGLKEEKTLLFYEINKFWKKLLASKHNTIATNY